MQRTPTWLFFWISTNGPTFVPSPIEHPYRFTRSGWVRKVSVPRCTFRSGIVRNIRVCRVRRNRAMGVRQKSSRSHRLPPRLPDMRAGRRRVRRGVPAAAACNASVASRASGSTDLPRRSFALGGTTGWPRRWRSVACQPFREGLALGWRQVVAWPSGRRWSAVTPPCCAMQSPGCRRAAPAWPPVMSRQHGGARRSAQPGHVRRPAPAPPPRHRLRAVRHQQVAPGNGPHALMRFRRGDHGARHGHRLQHLVLDAARDAQRRHGHRRMGQVGPHIRHAARDVHARAIRPRPARQATGWRRRCGNAAPARATPSAASPRRRRSVTASTFGR